MTPWLIIVSGPLSSGKTTLAKKLSQELNLPLICKDGYKEILFDSLGWNDREWSKKLGIAAVNLMFNCVESFLSKNISLIVEANFKSEFDTKRFLDIKMKHNFNVYQIQLVCDGEVLLKRFSARADSAERHPGHVESHNLDEFTEVLKKGILEPLELEGHLFKLDTTDFKKADFDGLLMDLKKKLSN